jgi:hypothetical protein
MIYSVRSIYLQSFKLILFVVIKLSPVQNSKSKIGQRAITPDKEGWRLRSSAVHFCSFRCIYLHSYKSIPFKVLKFCHGPNSWFKEKCREGDCFLCTVRLLRKIHILTHFYVHNFITLKLSSGKISKYKNENKGNNSIGRVRLVMHCILSLWDQSTLNVSSWYLLYS